MSNDGRQENGKNNRKYLTVTYHSDGNVDIESNNMTVFDLWALSNFIKMRADELYINTQTVERMKKQSGSPIEISRGMPGIPKGM